MYIILILLLIIIVLLVIISFKSMNSISNFHHHIIIKSEKIVYISSSTLKYNQNIYLQLRKLKINDHSIEQIIKSLDDRTNYTIYQNNMLIQIYYYLGFNHILILPSIGNCYSNQISKKTINYSNYKTQVNKEDYLLHSMDNIMLHLTQVSKDRYQVYFDILQHIIQGGMLKIQDKNQEKEQIEINIFQILSDKLKKAQKQYNIYKSIDFVTNDTNKPIYAPISQLYYIIDTMYFIILICGKNIHQLKWKNTVYNHEIHICNIDYYYINILNNILSPNVCKYKIIDQNDQVFYLIIYLPIKGEFIATNLPLQS